MMSRNFALYGGVLLVVMSVLSFIIPGSTVGLPVLNLNTSYGLFLGLFPMNIVNKLVMLTVGIAGIRISRRENIHSWIGYGWFVACAMGVLALLGLSGATNTLGGYYPLFGGVIAVNALFAIAGALCSYLTNRDVHHRGYKTHTHA